jgi:AcrR family transcriptional regulator
MLKSKYTPKAIRTRQNILDAAYRLFIEQGYDQATMRAIAAEAGIAAGGIYHYFPTKEHIVQTFYELSHEEHEEACENILAKEKKFIARLHAVIKKKMELAQPSHKLSRVLFRVASDPENSLSPFSKESSQTRQQSLGLFEKVVKESQGKMPEELLDVLPEYLWLYQMGIILFWIHDASPNCEKTFNMIDRTVNLIGWMTTTYSNPLFKPFRKKALAIVEEFKPDFGGKNEKEAI